MTPDEHRCPGYPTVRDTVRPIQQCQMCQRWQEASGGTEWTPRFVIAPGEWFDDAQVFGCDQFKEA